MRKWTKSACAQARVFLPVMFTLTLGIAASVTISGTWHHHEMRDAQQLLLRQQEAQLDSISKAMQKAMEAASAVNHLVAVEPDVTQDEFQLFSRPLLANNPVIHSFIFTRAPSRKHVSARRNASALLTSRMPAEERRVDPRASPLYYAVTQDAAAADHPEIENLFESSSLTPHGRAVRRITSSDPARNPQVLLLSPDQTNQERIAIIDAVRPLTDKKDAPPARLMPGENTQEIRAYTVTVFRAPGLLRRIFDAADAAGRGNSMDISLFLYAGDVLVATDLALGRQRATLGAWSWLSRMPGLIPARAVPARGKSFELAGTQWHAVSIPASDTALPPATGAVLLMITGCLITALAAIYVHGLAREAVAYEDTAHNLQLTQGQLHDLYTYQEKLKEEERKRIAREIHDDLGQNLLALRIEAQLLDDRTSRVQQEVNASVKLLLGQLDTITRSMRSIINNLRPPVLDLGLLAALEWLVGQLNARHLTRFVLDVKNDDFGSRLSDDQATSIFRIMQESLSNVVRHAAATEARILLSEQDDRLHIEISDNGIGNIETSPHRPCFGLMGIRERVASLGGTFTLDSIKNRGTTLRFDLDARRSAAFEGEEPTAA